MRFQLVLRIVLCKTSPSNARPPHLKLNDMHSQLVFAGKVRSLGGCLFCVHFSSIFLGRRKRRARAGPAEELRFISFFSVEFVSYAYEPRVRRIIGYRHFRRPFPLVPEDLNRFIRQQIVPFCVWKHRHATLRDYRIKHKSSHSSSHKASPKFSIGACGSKLCRPALETN